MLSNFTKSWAYVDRVQRTNNGNGIIEIYEKELRERARRFFVVKKMYARRYSQNEVMLDIDKLFD